ncbi:TIM-barrel domain-containing protein [Streptomyces sp. NBC_00102]|uniref:TIM-barrel domain-containing protein n=1 Tax=Streptomyces sp. NBC_00102 TaxID=2975652 RepID=UPI00224D61DD|nr:TIM-barrel domain-containing protein [Streptomyces sp. NBC_00102]MCX5395757.1 glycoside hydrolase family 31 protein [Streptomyces sp. NBC_00102]
MDGHDLVRSVKLMGSVGGMRTAWRSWRGDSWAPRQRGPELARVPGPLLGAEPGPGGGVVRFARSELSIRVAAGGAVFWAWDGAGRLPSYGLPGTEPAPDPRARLEPGTDGGWQVVSERLTVSVARDGAVELRTPGGVRLRRELPPRWWETAGGGPVRWVQRAELPADARFFGLGGPPSGPRLRSGAYPLGAADTRGAGRAGRAEGAAGNLSAPVLPVQFVVSDAGTHLVFYDSSGTGRMTIREGEEGAGSGHDRRGGSEVRVDGGPLRCWAVAGTPARVLRGWTALTGAPALPPPWALGPQLAVENGEGEREVRRTVAGHRDRGLPLSALHLVGAEGDVGPAPVGGSSGTAGLAGLAAELRAEGVRLVASGPVRREPVDDTAAPEGPVVVGAPGEGSPALVPRDPAQPVPAVPRPGERPFRLSSAVRAGAQRYGGVVTGGGEDGWPGLGAVLASVVGLGLCGVPYAGPDLGPYEDSDSPELYLRRLQLGARLPLFRLRAGSCAGGVTEGREPGEEVLGHARAALLERERLGPYFVTLAYVARLTGAPYVRPVWWDAPRDRGLRDCEDAFLLGDGLLVAPVLEPGTVRRTVRLPRGRWYDTVTGRSYEGPGRVTVEAPLSRIPVLARAGVVLPVRGEDGGTELEAWAPRPGRRGGGVLVRSSASGRGKPVVERFRTRWEGGGVVVERDGHAGAVPYPVRVRGV